MILQGYILSILYAALCLGFAFCMYKLGVAKWITRKIVHILVGAEWIILYHFVGPTIHFLVVCLICLAVLAISHRKSLMPMISSDGDNSLGTVYYAVAMSVMAMITVFVPSMIVPFGIGVFCTSLGDGLAGLVGQSIRTSWNKYIYGNKTIVGAATNLLACFGISILFNSYFELNLAVWQCAAIAAFALELELFTGRGLDNITITLGTSLLAYCFINFSATASYIIPILLTPAIIAIAYRKHALTLDGIFAAVIVDIAISLSLGNFGFCVLLAFFAGGIAVDKIKNKHKKARQNGNAVEKRGDCRNCVQVFANGIVASLCAVLYLFSSERFFIIGFVASLAEAFADTAASGIGAISAKAYDPFRMKPCTPGISGGMSILGTLSSIGASAVISLFALAFGRISISESLVILIAGFIGAIFDSFLGSLLQVKYKCSACGMIVEREEHCGQKTKKYSGVSFINNDTVNLLGTLFSALIASLLFVII